MTTTTTKALDDHNDHSNKVLQMAQDRAVSLLQNEDRCVTVAGLAWTHNVHRPQAAQVLEDAVRRIVTNSNNNNVPQPQPVRVTHCVVVRSEDEDSEENGNPPCTGKKLLAYLLLEHCCCFLFCFYFIVLRK